MLIGDESHWMCSDPLNLKFQHTKPAAQVIETFVKAYVETEYQGVPAQTAALNWLTFWKSIRWDIRNDEGDLLPNRRVFPMEMYVYHSSSSLFS
jgi:hypothetical protein